MPSAEAALQVTFSPRGRRWPRSGRMRGRAALDSESLLESSWIAWRGPSSVAFGDTFSNGGRRDLLGGAAAGQLAEFFVRSPCSGGEVAPAYTAISALAAALAASV